MGEYKELRHKYDVRKADTGEVVENCFVLRPDKDQAAVAALRAYAEATNNAALAADIISWIGAEPNEPLTMDELRQMDGDPVWVSVSDNWRESGVPEGWCIVRFHSEDDRVRVYVYDTRRGARFFSQHEYGMSWTAYRRKPNEG